MKINRLNSNDKSTYSNQKQLQLVFVTDDGWIRMQFYICHLFSWKPRIWRVIWYSTNHQTSFWWQVEIYTTLEKKNPILNQVSFIKIFKELQTGHIGKNDLFVLLMWQILSYVTRTFMQFKKLNDIFNQVCFMKILMFFRELQIEHVAKT